MVNVAGRQRTLLQRVGLAVMHADDATARQPLLDAEVLMGRLERALTQGSDFCVSHEPSRAVHQLHLESPTSLDTLVHHFIPG